MAKKLMFDSVTNVTGQLPFIFWQVASLGILIIIICMLVIHTGKSAYKKRLYGFFFVALLLGVVVAIEYYERSQEWHVIQKEEVPVYMGPDTKYPRLSTLKFHDEVRIIKHQGAWLQIEDNGRKGWIENEKIPEFVIFDKV